MDRGASKGLCMNVASIVARCEPGRFAALPLEWTLAAWEIVNAVRSCEDEMPESVLSAVRALVAIDAAISDVAVFEVRRVPGSTQ